MEEALLKSSGLISISASRLTLPEASHSCHGNPSGCPWPGGGGGRAGGARPLWMDACIVGCTAGCTGTTCCSDGENSVIRLLSSCPGSPLETHLRLWVISGGIHRASHARRSPQIPAGVLLLSHLQDTQGVLTSSKPVGVFPLVQMWECRAGLPGGSDYTEGLICTNIFINMFKDRGQQRTEGRAGKAKPPTQVSRFRCKPSSLNKDEVSANICDHWCF